MYLQHMSLKISKKTIWKFTIVSAGKHLSNTNLSDLSIVGTRDIYVYRKRHQIK